MSTLGCFIRICFARSDRRLEVKGQSAQSYCWINSSCSSFQCLRNPPRPLKNMLFPEQFLTGQGDPGNQRDDWDIEWDVQYWLAVEPPVRGREVSQSLLSNHNSWAFTCLIKILFLLVGKTFTVLVKWGITSHFHWDISWTHYTHILKDLLVLIQNKHCVKLDHLCQNNMKLKNQKALDPK